MKKNIITEISRIHQLMGTSLINEATVGGWKSIADDVLTFVASKSGKLSDDVTNLILKLKNAGDETEITKILSDLVNVSDEMGQIIIPKVLSTISDVERQYIDDAKDWLGKQINNKTIAIDSAKKMANNWVDTYVTTEFKGVKDMLKKELTDYIDNVVSKIDVPTPPKPNPPKPDIDDLSNQIPDDNSIITDSGKFSEIFDINRWNSESFAKLDDASIAKLLNQSFWDKAITYFDNLFKLSNKKIDYIQKLGKAIQNTQNTMLKSQLEAKLKKELEWLYKKNTNNFVYMKNFFDEIAKTNSVWAKNWSNIKSASNGGWDFYNAFGSVAQYVPKFERIWGGITNDMKVLFEAEKNLGSKIINKLFKKEISKVEMVGDFWTNFKTGSRKGFPTMSNEKYKAVIQKYGPTGAKASYFRDLVLTTLKWNMYVGLLVTFRNFIANSAYEDNIQACVVSGKLDSKECTDLNKNYFSRKMAEWSLKYRENPQESADFVKNWISEIFGFEANLPDIVTGDKWYKQLSEIATLDPGLIGEAVNLFFTLLNLNDNPERKQKLLDSIDEQIKFGKTELKKAEETVVDAVEDVKDVELPTIELTSTIIYEKHPCYLTNDKGQVSDTSFGENGIKIESPTNFKYKFIDDSTIWNITLKNDGKLYFDDGVEFTCDKE